MYSVPFALVECDLRVRRDRKTVKFYLGVKSIGRFTNGYLLLTELVPDKYSAVVGPILLSSDAAMIIYLTAYYNYVSK